MTFQEFLNHHGVICERGISGDWQNTENIIGLTVWICDYRLNADKAFKPIRNIQPTKVIVVSNDDLPKNKTICYSDVHFCPISGDKVLKKIIAPFDTTGYRGYPGESVKIFNRHSDCMKFYLQQLDTAKAEYSKKIEQLQDRVSDIEGMKKEALERSA